MLQLLKEDATSAHEQLIGKPEQNASNANVSSVRIISDLIVIANLLAMSKLFSHGLQNTFCSTDDLVTNNR